MPRARADRGRPLLDSAIRVDAADSSSAGVYALASGAGGPRSWAVQVGLALEVTRAVRVAESTLEQQLRSKRSRESGEESMFSKEGED